MVDSPMGTQNPGGSPGTESFTCFHGEEEIRPSIDVRVLIRRVEEFYAEAARRLPLKEMPDLLGCIHKGGHCFGLADPVTNIILNAIGLLRHREDHPQTDDAAARRDMSFYGVASKSFSGLFAFMTYYFRYMSNTQVRRYLSLASFDLPLAIKLVLHDRSISSESLPELLPDGGKIKAALRIASVRAKHPAPEVSAQLMTSRYPGYMLSLMNFLQEGKPLGVNHVYAIKKFLACQWPPSAPPPASIQFRCHPSSNDDTCRRLTDGTLLISTHIGNDLVAQVSIVRADMHCYQPISSHQYIFNPMLDNKELNTKLSECLAVVMSCRGDKPRARDDDPPCEHLLSLKLCLLDTIHAFYIKALAILPSCALSDHFIRALLIAGHCYGPLDPVSNIILNSIWYDIAFPFSRSPQLPQGICDTIHMARMESHSLDGLVAILSHVSTKHEAFEQILSSHCDFSGYALPEFTDVAKAAKHPQYAACGSFLNSLSIEMLSYLRSLLSVPSGERLPDFKWNDLKTTVLSWKLFHAESVPKEPPCSLLPYAEMDMSRKEGGLRWILSSVRTKVDPILREYCYQHPWESNFKLDIICGVTLTSSRLRSNVYHVNFLATPDDVETNERTLFFAEFWVPIASDPPPNPPRCCPVENYLRFPVGDLRSGRCSFCEPKGSKVVHPASGGHFGDTDGFEGLYHPHAHSVVSSDFEGLLDADYTYFDPDRDVELAKKMNSVHSHELSACI